VFSRPGSEGWKYFLHLSLSSVILVDSSTVSPVHVLMLSIQAVRILACVHLELFLALSLSQLLCNRSSRPTSLASLLWRCLTVPSLLQLVKNPLMFSLQSTKPGEYFSVLSSQRRQDVFFSFFLSVHLSLLQATLALPLVVSSLKSVWCDFSIFFCSDSPIAYPLFKLVRNSIVHSPFSVIRYGNVSACSSCLFWLSMRHAMPLFAIPSSCRRNWWVGCIRGWLGLGDPPTPVVLPPKWPTGWCHQRSEGSWPLALQFVVHLEIHRAALPHHHLR